MPQDVGLQPSVILYLIQGMIVLIAFVFAVVAAGAVRQPMPWRAWFWPMEGGLAVGLVAATYIVGAVVVAPVYLVATVAAGVPIGVLRGFIWRPYAAGGELVLRRSGFGWFLLIMSLALQSVAAWFLPKPFMSAALGGPFFFAGMLFASDVGRLVRGGIWAARVRGLPMAEAYIPPELWAEAEGAAAGPPSLEHRPRWAQDLADGKVYRIQDVEKKPRRRRRGSRRRWPFGRRKKPGGWRLIR